MNESEFCIALAEYFDLDPLMVNGETSLRNDLLFDSLMAIECIMLLEEAAGHEIEISALETIDTVGGLYLAYQQFAGVID